MSDNVFADGIFFNEKSDKAPEFILGSISVIPDKFIEWMNQQTPDEKGYIKLSILRSKKTGKPYISLDTWKPNQAKTKEEKVYGDDGEVVPF